jgi:opacity protein-like surface antigen
MFYGLEFFVKRLLFIATVTAVTLSASASAGAQAMANASRLGDLQVGAGYTIAQSDYLPNHIAGFAFYSDFDFRSHFGAEVDFHQLDATGTDSHTQVYERSYEFGARYFRTYFHGHAKPYVKALYGRGVFNFPQSEANLAYNMFVGGGGVDIPIIPQLNLRADFEYQQWLSFPPNGLTPTLITIGAAYHFPPGKPK